MVPTLTTPRRLRRWLSPTVSLPAVSYPQRDAHLPRCQPSCSRRRCMPRVHHSRHLTADHSLACVSTWSHADTGPLLSAAPAHPQSETHRSEKGAKQRRSRHAARRRRERGARQRRSRHAATQRRERGARQRRSRHAARQRRARGARRSRRRSARRRSRFVVRPSPGQRRLSAPSARRNSGRRRSSERGARQRSRRRRR